MAQSGSEVHYTSPDSAQEIVANATPAKGDLLAQWQQAEGDTSKGLDYRRIRLERTTFRGEPAVAWEYTVMAKGRTARPAAGLPFRWHVVRDQHLVPPGHRGRRAACLRRGEAELHTAVSRCEPL